jgi:ATP-dependent Clp protease ATP-binding subunit ClpC
MAEHEVTLELTPEAKDLLVEKGYDPAMGARPLRRAIQRFIEDPLADFVLGRTLEPGSRILVGHKAADGEGETTEGEPEVDIVVLPPDIDASAVTVPPDEPELPAAEEPPAEAEES